MDALATISYGGVFMNYHDFISVGIDVASEFSWACIVTPDHKPVGKPIRIDHHSIPSLDALKVAIKKVEEVNSMEAHIFLESTGIYHIPLFYHLTESGFKVFILNPLITDSTKNQGIRKVKSDKSDAFRIATTAYTANLKTSLIPSDLVLNIRLLTREYHKLSDEHTAYVNQLIKELAVVFPSYATVFSTVLSKTSIAILLQYKTPKNILAAPQEELLALIQQSCKQGHAKSIQIYNKLIEAAKLAMVFSHQLSSSYDLISLKLDAIALIERQKESVLENIREQLHAESNSDFSKQVQLMESIKGVGFISAVSLMSEIGDFRAFMKPKQLVAYFGLDPAVNQSGKFKGTRVSMSKRGSRLARRVLFIIAVAAIRTTVKGEAINPVMREYYQKLCERKAKKVAIGAVMRKMTNIIFAVLRDGKPFQTVTVDEHCMKFKAKLVIAA
jgi:transposase